MNTLDPETLQEASIELKIRPALIEKDWYSVQMLKLLSNWDAEGLVRPVFTGGTSLSKVYRVISRFSEDIDIRLETMGTLSRKRRSQIRDNLIAHLKSDGWSLEDIHARNENQFVNISINYPVSDPQPSLRPFMKLELNYKNPRCPVLEKPVSSFITELEKAEPEVSAIHCLALEEIASEKLSALCWRMADAKQSDRIDLVRHLHDLACLSPKLTLHPDFVELVLETVKSDLDDRAKLSTDLAMQKIKELPGLLAPYSQAYESYVIQTSYGKSPTFGEALAQLETLIGIIK